MLYEVEYDLQWGSRGNRSVIFYLTDKKPTTKQIVGKLKQHGITHPNTQAITVKEMPLEVMQKRENGRSY